MKWFQTLPQQCKHEKKVHDNEIKSDFKVHHVRRIIRPRKGSSSTIESKGDINFPDNDNVGDKLSKMQLSRIYKWLHGLFLKRFWTAKNV